MASPAAEELLPLRQPPSSSVSFSFVSLAAAAACASPDSVHSAIHRGFLALALHACIVKQSEGSESASYYTSLGLFVLSVPGLWSLIKRSVKSKKTFVREEGQPTAPSLVAGEILSFFTRNSFAVSDRGEVITGVYYWTKASRKEEIKVKMVLSDDGNNVSEILVRGDDVQVEQMRRELKMSEKGMIYVKGIFET
ncbi:hypothetical protein TRIUR3_02659 [Triticum urartu]|uniref:Uncharacterized protein n=1 Tax=Triticum urartu TaxID=4572 RepID=M7YEG7_TRIUA|nr:hypothetical protein TRIUR3_02659 [Triticum urartu]